MSIGSSPPGCDEPFCLAFRAAWPLHSQYVLISSLKTPFEFCGEREEVSGVHNLLDGVVQVCHEFLVGEEEENVKEQGRQEDREVESGDQGEETMLKWMAMMMVVSEVRTRLELEPM